MNGEPVNRTTREDSAFVRQVSAELDRKVRVQRTGKQDVWFGLGMSGLIGWSVAVPTLAGTLLGVWLDRRYPGGHSWTLALLVAGLIVGCANAWHWVAQQDREMHYQPEEKKDE
jgi:ATP synthase protein I